jgi:hypothetical protein
MSAPASDHSGNAAAHPAGWPAQWPPGGVVFWFRHDLRLHDNPALTHALQLARQRHTWLLPVVVLDPAQTTALTPWGFARQGPHRSQFVAEGIAAPEEQATVAALRSALDVEWRDATVSELGGTSARMRAGAETTPVLTTRLTALWQSTLFAPDSLPMPPEQVPDTFTAFRPSTAPTTALTGCGSSCCGATTFAGCTCKHGRRCTGPGAGPRVRPRPRTTRMLCRWCAGQTGQPLVDAGMRELATTGY